MWNVCSQEGRWSRKSGFLRTWEDRFRRQVDEKPRAERGRREGRIEAGLGIQHKGKTGCEQTKHEGKETARGFRRKGRGNKDSALRTQSSRMTRWRRGTRESLASLRP
jgi:hypothetical protein